MKPAVRSAMIIRENHHLLSIEEFRVPCAGKLDSIVEDAELLAREIGVKSQEIQSLN